MTAALAVAPPCSDALELGFVDDDGKACREPLATCWGRSFESAAAVRRFSSYKGQSNFPGLWWSATTGDHVGFESWLERDHAMMLDFDAEVVGFASQPFWLHWRSGMDCRRHAPDFLARLADGTGVVVDVRADDNVDPDAAAAFSATAEACKSVGWRYGGLAPWTQCSRLMCGGCRATGILVALIRVGPRDCTRCSRRLGRCWRARPGWVTRSGCFRCCFTCCGVAGWSRT